MRTKLRPKLAAGLAVFGAIAIAAAAHAGAITVTLYHFTSQGDVQSFYKVEGAKCSKKWRKQKTLGIIVGKGTNACGFRSSVVADSTDPGPDQEMAASANLAASTPAKLSRRIYTGIAVRQSDNAGYVLRVYPVARRWQVFRDAKGSSGQTLLGSGSAKFIRPVGKRNNLLLRAFDYGSDSVTLLAEVNGKKVLSQKDSSPDKPDGRRNVVILGARGKTRARGAVASFDDVANRVPNPF